MLNAPWQSQAGFQGAVQAVNNLAVAQSREEAPNSAEVRPAEFHGKEGDVQHLSQKTESFFAGVIRESEMMLDWSAEQVGDHSSS